MSDEKKDDQSAAYRAKKFFASATVGTKAGRKVITGLLGDEGELVLKAFKSAAAKFSNDSKAKELKTDVLKLAVKAKLCADEGRLTEKTTMHAVQPINSLCLQILSFLQQQPGKVDVAPLAGNFNRIRDIIVDIMQPHLKPKNLEKLVNVFKFVGDAGFLNAVLNDDKFAAERASLKEHLTHILTPLLQNSDAGKGLLAGGACKVLNCKFPCAEPKGAFRGSEYCARHHIIHHEAQVAKPVLEHFIDPADYCSSFFIQYLGDFSRKQKEDDHKGDPAIDLPLYHFYDAVAKYKTVGRNLRKNRAELVFNKYLREQPGNARGRGSIFVSASKENLAARAIPAPMVAPVSAAANPKDLTVKLDDDILRKIQEELLFSDAQASSLATIFDEAQAVARARLDQCFAGFLKSEYFHQYAASMTLPPDVRELVGSVSLASLPGVTESKS